MPYILVVCTANICRSPVGEVILRDRLQKRGLQDWIVASAGTWGLDEHDAAPHSIMIMAELGFKLQNHRARTITEEMLTEADLVLCMEPGHVEALRAEFYQQHNKVFLLSEMVDKKFGVQDPYGGPIEGFRRMAREIIQLIDDGLEKIILLAQGAN